MSEDEQNRLIAWNRELAAAHQRLRQALHDTRDTLDKGDVHRPGAEFGQALTAAVTANELARHLDGLSAIMESHFSYEERTLRDILAGVETSTHEPARR